MFVSAEMEHGIWVVLFASFSNVRSIQLDKLCSCVFLKLLHHAHTEHI